VSPYISGHTRLASSYRMASTLKTDGNWVAGDDLRIIEALKVPFGDYSLTCIGNCGNQLEEMSPQAVLNVRAQLDAYEAAKTAESTQNLSDTEGKTLVKADVLEWEPDAAGQVSGATKEMTRAQEEIAQYFAFCSCAASLMGNKNYGSTLLIRS